MKKSIGSYEAKTNLSGLLDKVAKGETFTITKRGQPVAILSPVTNQSEETLEEIIKQIQNLRKNFKLGSFPLKKLISSGRK